MTGEIFRTYVRQFLVPALAPGNVVVLDNLPAHKAAGVEAMIREAGASLMYLPPYSPDLHPIEQALAEGNAQKGGSEKTRGALGHNRPTPRSIQP